MNNTVIKNTLFILSTLLFAACSKETTSETNSKRLIFDQGNLKVITTSINPQLATMSVLYGNNEAYQAALNGNGVHIPGEKYVYLTWKYIENPRWFGSNISENLLAIESIDVKEDEQKEYLFFDYKIEEGNPLPVDGIQLTQKDRIAYIFEYRPSVLP